MPAPPNWDRVLILEMSTAVGQVALASGAVVLAEGQLDRQRRRASDLAAVCQQLLRDHGWRAKDLTAVVVGMGPGSYTALRVGVASATMLAYAAGCAFVGVETFAAYAAQTSGPHISVIADALQGEVYCRTYHHDPDGLLPTHALEIRRLTDWQIGTAAETVVTGPGVSMLNGSMTFALEAERALRPLSLLHVAQKYSWAVTADMWAAEPFYLRGSSAEEKKRKDESAA